MADNQLRVGEGVPNGGEYRAGHRNPILSPPTGAMRRVSVEVKERQLKSMNAKVAEYSNGNRLCTSYEIPVAAYVDFDKDRPEGEKSGFGAIVLGADWARSNATIGHVSEFLQELGGGKLRAADIRAQIANGGITVVPTSDMRRIVSSN